MTRKEERKSSTRQTHQTGRIQITGKKEGRIAIKNPKQENWIIGFLRARRKITTDMRGAIPSSLITSKWMKKNTARPDLVQIANMKKDKEKSVLKGKRVKIHDRKRKSVKKVAEIIKGR